MAFLEAVTIHARDPVSLARFWSVALDLPIDPTCAAAIDAGTRSPREPVLLGRRDGLHVWVSPADDLAPPRGRVHLDVQLEHRVEEQRLAELGAVLVQPHQGWTVYEDPEGNRFCVVPPPVGPRQLSRTGAEAPRARCAT